MKQVRKCAFETNSSSTHVITIQKENVLDNINVANTTFKIAKDFGPYGFSLNVNDFGWEHRTYYDAEDKLMYLIIAISSVYRDDDEVFDKKIKQVKDWLHDVNLDVMFPEYIKKDHSYKDSNGVEHTWTERGWVNGKYTAYIDHTEDLVQLVSYVFEDKNHFYNFIFGVKSFIETGNDNDETFDWWYDKDYSCFDDMWNDNKRWWVQDGEDENVVYEEMKERHKNNNYHIVSDDVVEFYKGN